MKKFVVATLALAFVAGMTSCKKDYECCITEDGTKVEGTCTTVELSKKEKDDLEAAGLAGFTGDTYKYECTEK